MTNLLRTISCGVVLLLVVAIATVSAQEQETVCLLGRDRQVHHSQ